MNVKTINYNSITDGRINSKQIKFNMSQIKIKNDKIIINMQGQLKLLSLEWLAVCTYFINNQTNNQSTHQTGTAQSAI